MRPTGGCRVDDRSPSPRSAGRLLGGRRFGNRLAPRTIPVAFETERLADNRVAPGERQGEMTRNRVRARAVAGAALAAAALVPGVARADGGPAGPRPVGRAGGTSAEAALSGRRIALGEAAAESDIRDGRPAVSAVGLGASSLAEQTRSVAGSGEAGLGGRRCATPPSPVEEAGALSVLAVGAACGEARASDGSDGFTADSRGQVVTADIAAPAIVARAVASARSALDPAMLSRALGEVRAVGAPSEARAAVGVLDRLLGSLAPGVDVTDLPAKSTVADLLDTLGQGPVARLTLGTASARSAGDAASYLSRAATEGGTVDVLPGLFGTGAPPLVRILVAPSAAEVKIDRRTGQAVAGVTNPVAHIESPLLASLGLPVLPNPTEVTPGGSVSVLCQGPMSFLCTEIAVARPTAPVTTPDGRTSIDAAPVTVRILRSPHFPADSDANGDSGIQLTFGRVRAEAVTGNAVISDVQAAAAAGPGAEGTAGPAAAAGVSAVSAPAPEETAAPAPAAAEAARQSSTTLPRTGGLPASPALIPAALLASAAISKIGRRWAWSRS